MIEQKTRRVIMRNIIIISAFLASFILSNNSLAYSASKNQTAVEDYFKSSEEPKVLDALWTDEAIFKVGVRNDGSGRDGYAQYVCLVLNSKGFKGKDILVRVIDLPKLIASDEWVNLGTAFCK
jgi:ABC-type sulfate transport system permease subunit